VDNLKKNDQGDTNCDGPVLSGENSSDVTSTSVSQPPTVVAAAGAGGGGGGKGIRRNAGKGNGYPQKEKDLGDDSSSVVAVEEEDDSGEDDKNDDRWLDGVNSGVSRRTNSENRPSMGGRAEALWIQYPNILAVSSSTNTTFTLSSLSSSLSMPFPSSTMLVPPGKEEYYQDNDIKRRYHQREHQREVNDILSTLNAELGSELMVPVLSKDMASFYTMEHNNDGGYNTTSLREKNVKRRQYNDKHVVEKEEEDQIIKFYGLNSGAKLMVRLCVYDLI